MGDNGLSGARWPIKILMTADAVGGVWQYTRDLISPLAESGAEVLIATMGPRPSEEQKSHLLAIPGVSLAQSEYALEWMPDSWNDVERAGRWLLSLAAEFRADLIHLNGYSHAALPWRQPVIVTAHSCVYSWWKAVHDCEPDIVWAEYKQRVTAGLRASDAIVAPSAFMAAAIQNQYGVDERKLRVIHNFSCAHNFSRAPRPGRNEKSPVLLAAGRIWDRAKNFSLLEQIAPRVKWEIQLAGSGREPDFSAPAARSVRCLGSLARAEVLHRMEAASIFLHPALYEPFGLSVLEAACRRCCLILADIPSLRELWAGAAVLVNPRDPEQWVSEINALIDDPDRRKSLGYLALLRARRYRAGTAMRKYMDLYRQVTSVKRHREAAA